MKRRILIYFLFSQIFIWLSLFSALDFKYVYASEKKMYTENLIPKMTSATTPKGRVIASYVYSLSGYFPWNAFDYDPYDHSFDNSYWYAAAPIQWIGYEFESPVAICKYTIQSVWTVPYRCPKDFIFQGSNDGVNWTDLDARTGLQWSNPETKTFYFNNVKRYRQYRIYIQSIVAGSEISIDQIEMMSLSRKPEFKVDLNCEKNVVNLKEPVNAELVLNKVPNMRSVDVRIKYDNTKLKYKGISSDGTVKVLRSRAKNGEIQLVILNQGMETRSKLLNLNFEAIGRGASELEVSNAKVLSIQENKVYSIANDDCGFASINID